MEKIKTYENVRFSAEVLREAIELFWEETNSSGKLNEITIEVGSETWRHEKLEEFFADYRRSPEGSFAIDIISNENRLRIHDISLRVRVLVAAADRGRIEKVFSLFERNLLCSLLPVPPEPEPPPPVIFIGHGRNPAWRDLKDHLHEKHGYEVVAYETGARAGHTIRDVLEDMANESTLALLVLTAEDEQGDGGHRARQNVVHEVGLFQGRLGFSKAIALIEEGVDLFSNLQGIEQIPFKTIRETFGEVVATIKREHQ